MKDMMTKHLRKSKRTQRSRRGGLVMIYVALGLVVFLSIAGYAVDMNLLYMRKARVQRAADAAALAGAWMLANLYSKDQAFAKSQEYATSNGYQNGPAGTTVTTTYPVAGGPPNYYRVSISRPERTFFAGIMGINSVQVAATSTAVYLTLAPMNIVGGTTNYGSQTGPTTLSVFGPAGFYPHGDPYGVKELANGDPNPLYTGRGYDFDINVPETMTATDVEIFDPECYNAGGVASPATGTRFDEYWRSDGSTGSASHHTTTQYTLYADNGTPNNPNDDTQISRKTFGNASGTDLTWDKTFSLDRSAYVGQNFRLNVTATSGSSENGFNLRAGPPRATPSTPFDPNNGTSITAQGRLPMNFNKNGSSAITLGYVPAEAAGSQLLIRKFDTDVGSQSVTYTCDSLPGKSFPGILAGNGVFTTDTISLPEDYTGGNWLATYQAGIQDTSQWEMSYTGSGPGRPGGVKLVE
ncbi:MAG: hypothetical protein JWN98_1048 [Abditibacteriota bacterium]|nr:hypothetical protein [Abditibacteriota bacterium]